ncbi:MAG: COG4315 family predicted lipoprotein, partial [Solirubrobacteraceae bacterium]
RTTRATLATATVPGYGRVLATAAGRPVFLFTADPRGSSRCSGACASTWSPLTAHGRPVAGAGVSASLLSSFKRAGGTTQVLYNGHALYTHAGGSPGSYAGMASDGGVWYLVSTSGAAIKTTKGGGY